MDHTLPNRKSFISTLLILFSPTLILLAQNFSKTNHATWYMPDAPLHSSLLIWSKSPDSLEVLSSFSLRNGRDINSYQLLLHTRKNLDQDTIKNNTAPLEVFKKEGNRFLARTRIPLKDSLHYVILEVKDPEQPGTSYWSVVTLNPDFSYPPPSFYISRKADGFPLFANYHKSGDPLLINGNAPSYSLFFYDKEFEAADPPQSASPAANSSLDVTDTKTINPEDGFSPEKEGLYFIQRDTTALRGQSFRTGSPYYPEVGTLEEFAGPIRYLSTQEEWDKLVKNDFSKKEIDRFWLKVAQTQERAKRIIKAYYDQVALANQYFTSYKEGWKTDQGMIYILYGAPDIVTAEADREIWIYLKGAELPEIKFTFMRVKNPFTDRHFVLLRSKNYLKPHYQVVSQWRRGKRTL